MREPNESAQQPITVVIADDEQLIRTVLTACLNETTLFEVTGVAATAEEAIQLADRLRPDVALIDVNMPGGGEAARYFVATLITLPVATGGWQPNATKNAACVA